MARIKGLRKIHRYTAEFKVKAVRFSELKGVQVTGWGRCPGHPPIYVVAPSQSLGPLALLARLAAERPTVIIGATMTLRSTKPSPRGGLARGCQFQADWP
jgi:hypothetical protein